MTLAGPGTEPERPTRSRLIGSSASAEKRAPVSEGGGGEAEGFELSEQELIEEAESSATTPADRGGEPEATKPTRSSGRQPGHGDEPPEGADRGVIEARRGRTPHGDLIA